MDRFPITTPACETNEPADGLRESPSSHTVHYRTATIEADGQSVEVFYREAGDPAAPTVLLLHGFPTSSRMFRDLIPALADRYHIVAPDYPGFGYSSMPLASDFDYSFETLTDVVESLADRLGLDRYALYVMDYGAPIGFRLAVRHPDRVTALVVQNGNAYDEGLSDFWDPLQRYWDAPTPANGDGLRSQFAIDAVRWQYTHGVRDPEAISPDNWTFDQHLLDRPGNQEIQLALFYDYRTNVELYPVFQAYFREHQPPTLLVWGARDDIFPPEGARAYQRDLNGAELHLLDTGHFALEEDGAEIARLMLDFLGRHLSAAR